MRKKRKEKSSNDIPAISFLEGFAFDFEIKRGSEPKR